MDPASQPAAGASSFKTPQMDETEWSATTPTTTTPSRHTFPRRLSLLQNDAASPVRSTMADQAQEGSRRTSFTGPKPLNLVSQPLSSAVPSSASSSGPDTPRRGKRTSLSYIPSPSKTKIDDAQLSRAPSTSSASGRTRTGSISRATTTASRRRPSQASQASTGANSDAEDWLMSEEDASFSMPSAARAMAQRDSAKVEARFQDTGYREGITAGKLSTLQNGFDQGFNEVGAPLGREVGVLRGQLAALLLLTSPSSSTDAAPRSRSAVRGAGRMRSAGSSTPSLPLLAHPRLDEARQEMHTLAAELDSVTLAQLAEPDYDALVHDHEHAAEAGGAGAALPTRETHEQKCARTAILPHMHARLDRNGALTGQTRDLLRLIAEKERRCFELRDELATEEAELQQLRAAWQRTATRELAYGTSPTHRRNGSASSSTSRPTLGRTDSTDSTAAVLPVGVPQAAAEAWSSLSAKLPGGLKSQLNHLLESITNLDQPPEVPEKRAEDAGMLRPAPLSTGLSVLEEEGSDVGSAAVSPRSPRSPAVPVASARAPLQHERLSSLAAQHDSSVLGFAVDANGIATPSVQLTDEQPPPTPPKEAASDATTKQSRRTSVLGSFSQLQSRLTGSADETSGGFASMFTRRLKEARDNASDLLREAERKLGNAMTIDDLLGISTDETPAPQAAAQSRSPQIRLEAVAAEASWAEAAVGVRSPNLAPADAVGRTSVSSSRSSLSLPLPVRSPSPHSPPIGGAPGAAAFGVLHNGSSTSINRASKASVDGWNWSKEHEWDQ